MPVPHGWSFEDFCFFQGCGFDYIWTAVVVGWSRVESTVLNLQLRGVFRFRSLRWCIVHELENFNFFCLVVARGWSFSKLNSTVLVENDIVMICSILSDIGLSKLGTYDCSVGPRKQNPYGVPFCPGLAQTYCSVWKVL
jgi:hypothetical protein